MSFIFMNRSILIRCRQLLFGFGALVAWLTLVASDFHPIVAIVLVGLFTSFCDSRSGLYRASSHASATVSAGSSSSASPSSPSCS